MADGFLPDARTTVLTGAAGGFGYGVQSRRSAITFGDIAVPEAQLKHVDTKQKSIYAQELAVMVFGTEALPSCCLTGSSMKGKLPKEGVKGLIEAELPPCSLGARGCHVTTQTKTRSLINAQDLTHTDRRLLSLCSGHPQGDIRTLIELETVVAGELQASCCSFDFLR
ncbi:hypothetical protein HPB47_025431, partial [Ixodes persulcatus]